MVNQYYNKGYLKRDLISHTVKVCSLFRRLIRNVEFSEDDFFEQRYKKLLIRAEFDKYKNVKDLRKAKALLEMGENHFKKNVDPFYAAHPVVQTFSKEGIAYDREDLSPDWVMDYHHPLEKARYPYYFAKREQMKDEYIELWKKKMMVPNVDEKKNS